MAKGPKTKKKSRVIEAEGVAHISATFNNTLITISDLQGNAITWGVGRKERLQGLQEVDSVRGSDRGRELRQGGAQPGREARARTCPGARVGARVGDPGAAGGGPFDPLDQGRHPDTP